MNKNTLNEAVKACKEETKEALQTVYDELNNGQQKKLKALFERYEVTV